MQSRLITRRGVSYVTAVSLALAPLGSLAGCESAPGDEPEQGAVIGGVGGALAGAAVAGDDDRLLGALIGGVLGAGGGYLIGSQLDKKEDEAREASERARENPATADQARDARSADVNGDGFVTLDEVIAMEQAGVEDQAMIDRLRATDQVFVLNDSQRDQLRDAGVSNDVIDEMPRLNREQLSQRRETDGNDRISQPR